MTISFILADEVPADAGAVGTPVFRGRILPAGAAADLDLGYLAERGFEGRPGEARRGSCRGRAASRSLGGA